MFFFYTCLSYLKMAPLFDILYFLTYTMYANPWSIYLNMHNACKSLKCKSIISVWAYFFSLKECKQIAQEIEQREMQRKRREEVRLVPLTYEMYMK